MGGIGRDLKRKAEALGMEVQYHNRSQLSEEMSGGAKYVTFEDLLGTSDVISLNVPLNVRPSSQITPSQLFQPCQETARTDISWGRTPPII